MRKQRTALVLILLVVVLQSCQYYKSLHFPAEQHAGGFFSLIEKPGNIAHRGASGEYPENTLPAFLKGFEQGASAIELDVWLTADNAVVVIHDATVDRTTNGTGKVSDFTLEEIRKLDAAYHFKPEAGYPYRGRGIAVSTLDEVLKAFPENAILIEIKSGGKTTAKEVANVIIENQAQNRVLIASFRDRSLRQTARLVPGVPRTAASGEALTFYLFSHLGIAGFMSWSFDGLFIPPSLGKIPVLTVAMRNAAIASGMQTFVWTVNDEDAMQGLLQKRGVDGILTDYPQKLQDQIHATETEIF